MRLKSFLLLLLICCTGCNQEVETASEMEKVFDEARWKTRMGKDYPYREEMLEDLMTRQGLRKLEQPEINDLLGEPDRVNENHLYYRVSQKRLGFLPLHTKTMVIKLAADSTVSWVKIHE